MKYISVYMVTGKGMTFLHTASNYKKDCSKKWMGKFYSKKTWLKNKKLYGLKITKFLGVE